MRIMIPLVILFIASQVMSQTIPVVSGCDEASYVNGDTQASIAIQSKGYTPRCLRVVVGSTVTFAASKKHPLMAMPGDGNPVPSSESNTSATFSQTGVYGYYCTEHGDSSGNGMAGAVWVVESL